MKSSQRTHTCVSQTTILYQMCHNQQLAHHHRRQQHTNWMMRVRCGQSRLRKDSQQHSASLRCSTFPTQNTLSVQRSLSPSHAKYLSKLLWTSMAAWVTAAEAAQVSEVKARRVM